MYLVQLTKRSLLYKKEYSVIKDKVSSNRINPAYPVESERIVNWMQYGMKGSLSNFIFH